jgi:type IV pilus assembly protein PilA
MNSKHSKGFTLIELMIVTAIIGLLLSLALPAFVRYTDRARFSEAVLATNQYKAAIELAATRGLFRTPRDMFSGTNGVPNFQFGQQLSDSQLQFIGVVQGSIWVLWGNDGSELASVTYVLRALNITPPIQWVTGGSCLTSGYC